MSVYLLMFMLAVTVSLAYFYDTPDAYLTKANFHNTIEDALQAAATLSAAKNGYAPIDSATALANFQLYLQKNLQLDSNSMPLSSSPLASQVKILQFNVLDTIPTTDPIKGDAVNDYSIEAVVTTSVKQELGGMYGGAPYTITDFARVSLKKPS